MIALRRALTLTATLGLSCLAACGSAGKEELHQWMTAQRNATQVKASVLDEPFQFAAQIYSEKSSIEPFSNQKLIQAFKQQALLNAADSELIALELNRPKESLEFMPIESISMVGTLKNKGQNKALVKVDKAVYLVKIGDHLGQNYGRITAVTDNTIVLSEVIQDVMGVWINKPLTLQLLQTSEEKKTEEKK